MALAEVDKEHLWLDEWPEKLDNWRVQLDTLLAHPCEDFVRLLDMFDHGWH